MWTHVYILRAEVHNVPSSVILRGILHRGWHGAIQSVTAQYKRLLIFLLTNANSFYCYNCSYILKIVSSVFFHRYKRIPLVRSRYENTIFVLLLNVIIAAQAYHPMFVGSQYAHINIQIFSLIAVLLSRADIGSDNDQFQ